jgi:hypothetical protein
MGFGKWFTYGWCTSYGTKMVHPPVVANGRKYVLCKDDIACESNVSNWQYYILEAKGTDTKSIPLKTGNNLGTYEEAKELYDELIKDNNQNFKETMKAEGT